MAKYVFVIAVLLSCTNADRTTSTLEAQGFHSIELKGWSPRGCAESDSTCTGFEAVGPTGKVVSGAVGCGRDFGGCGGKGCTIRFD